jgi:hypothetical protein
MMMGALPMSKSEFLICVNYYSLPEFPTNCRIVQDNSLLIRDNLVCNPRNDEHIKKGGQYDPHYEHEPAPQYMICMDGAREKIHSIASNGSYEKVYLLFRTGRVSLSRKTTHQIGGYYDVDLNKVTIDPEYETPIIYAEEAIFVDAKDAVDISEFQRINNTYRFWFSSETRNGAFHKDLNSWKKKISMSQNRLKDYAEITERLEKIFKLNEFEEGMYGECKGCTHSAKCFLAKRIHRRGKLYHQLPRSIARKINRFYKSNI